MKGRGWTKKEIQFLLSNREIFTADQIATKLKRTKAAILKKTTKLRKVGFKLPHSFLYEKPKSRIPPKTKFQRIIKNRSTADVALELSVSNSTVLRWKRVYGIEVHRAPRPWTEEEAEYIISYYGRATLNEIARCLNRSKRMVSNQTKFLRKSGRKIAKKSARPQKFKGKKPSKDVLERMLQNFSSYQISKKVGTSDSNIRYWIKSYGIKIPKKRLKRVV